MSEGEATPEEWMGAIISGKPERLHNTKKTTIEADRPQIELLLAGLEKIMFSETDSEKVRRAAEYTAYLRMCLRGL
jgi:hypothetical protein